MCLVKSLLQFVLVVRGCFSACVVIVIYSVVALVREAFEERRSSGHTNWVTRAVVSSAFSP